MPSPSRARRIAKWSGVVVCVMLVLAWVFTTQGYVIWKSADGLLCVACRRGAFSLIREDPYPITVVGWNVRLYQQDNDEWNMDWKPGIWKAPTWILYRLPIWIPMFLVVLPTAYLFWRDRRPPRGHCQKCGYDLQGNVSGVCPECGQAT